MAVSVENFQARSPHTVTMKRFFVAIALLMPVLSAQVSQAQKDALKNDLYAMVHSGNRPDEYLVEQLASDLSSSLADGKITALDKTRLMKDAEKVMNSAGISTAQASQAVSDAQAILTGSGIGKADVQKIGADLKAIAAQAQRTAPVKAQSLKQRLKKQYR
jgi:hypothetical protein